MEQEQEFISQIIFNAQDIEPMNIHKKIGYCIMLSNVLDLKLVFPKDLNHYDQGFSRKFFLLQAIMQSDKNIDYLSADYGVEDPLSFDSDTWGKILQINKICDNFIGTCAIKLKGEFNPEFDTG